MMVDALANGVWRVSCLIRGGVLSVNCYVLQDDAGYTAIEAGPVSCSDVVLAGVATLVQPRDIARLVMLDDSPFSASAAIAWRNAGFKGPMVADWRTALGLAEAGVPGPFHHIHQERDVLESDGRTILEFRLFPGYPGQLYAMHVRSACLFTGALGSSIGRNLPLRVDQPGRPAQLYRASFGAGDPGLMLLSAGFSAVPELLCPRFGPSMPFGAIYALSAGDANVGQAALGAMGGPSGNAQEISALLQEIEQLRADNLDLQSAMVVASDAALRDETSGLYARTYADEFIRSIFGQGTRFCAAFIEIDRLKEYNRMAGVASGDRLINEVAGFLQEHAGEGYLFRWAGPIFLLVLESSREPAYLSVEAIRAAMESERRFSRPVTISAAIVGSDELQNANRDTVIQDLHGIARARLKLLERRGGNEVLAESGAVVQVKSLALVMDGDAVASEYLIEFLNRHDFSAAAAYRGAEALEMMEKYKPEVIIADAYLPQFDAFQIRTRMLASADLRRIPFVLLVHAKTDALVERAHQLQIFHIYEKPVPLRELLGVIRYLVRWTADGN
jgi:diguanylate cyclase (GGDEF)-like protein